MKKTYISPTLLSVELRTTNSILTVSGGDMGTMGIMEDDLTNSTEVWTKEQRGNLWDNEW